MTAIAAGTLIAQPAAAQSSDTLKAYDIPARPLADALMLFSQQSGIQVTAQGPLVDGRSGNAVRGRFPPDEALNRLLLGTGLTFRFDGPDAVRLEPAPVTAPSSVGPSPAGGKAILLGRVTVTAAVPRLYETPDVNAGALGMREMQDVPFSIGSYTTDMIESQRARTALDVLKNDPSVTPVTYGGTFDGVAVRGFSANTFNNVRRDGLLANVYSDVPLENKERVDVLKGVSGFLYGVGDPSGLVNYVLKRPTRDPFLSFTGEVRTQDGYYANIDAGGPFGKGGAGYRLNAAVEGVGNFTHPGDLRRYFIGGALDFRLHPDIMLQLDFDYQKRSQSAVAGITPFTGGTLISAERMDPRQLVGQPWARYRSESWNIGSRLDYAISADWTLTGQFGYGSTKRHALFHNIFSLAPNGDVLDGSITYEGENYRVMSGQLFATGFFETGPLRHELVAGYSYSKMEYPEGPYLTLPGAIGNIFRPIATPRPFLPNDTGLPQARSIQHSPYFSDTISFSDNWSAVLGARYIDYVNDKPRDYPDSGIRLRYKTSTLVPTASLLFKPAAHTTIYATYTRGFEQGAYAPASADNAYQRLDPIKSTQYEIGVKSTVVEGLTLTAAAFDIDKPLQAVSTADNIFRTRGRQHHRGIELSANGTITERLSGILGFTWLDAKQRDTGDMNIDGRRPANVARFKVNAFFDYQVAAVPGLSVNAGYYHVGGRPITGTNAIVVEGFDRWDLGAAYTTTIVGKPTILRLTVQNVADRRYWESVVYGTVGLGQPRTARLSLTTNF